MTENFEPQRSQELTPLELQGLITLAVRNGVLSALAMTAVVSLLLGLVVALLR